MQNSYISRRLGMLRTGSSASLEEGSPEERSVYLQDQRDPGGASLTMMSLGSTSHVESGSRVSVRSAELQCRTTLIGRRRDLRAQPAHRGAGWSKDYTPVRLGGHPE